MTPPEGAATPRDAAPPAAPPVVTTAELLRGGREVVTILHAGEAYRLRLTSKDRLLLTR